VEIVFTMLAHPEAVKDAALGQDGFLANLAPGRFWVDCSTVNPSFSMEMAARARALGIRFLDAPVTGSKEPAALGKLIFWVGGEPADVGACRSLFQCMGSRIVHGGRQGTGASLKMVMNQLLGTTMAVFAEGLVLGRSMGLPLEILFEAVLGGPVAAPFVAAKRGRIENGNFEDADFLLRWLQKDLHLASVSAYETGVSGHSKPASKGRMKTSHFEGSIACWAAWAAHGRNERTQCELAAYDINFGGQWLVQPADCA
jgi:3-hydroxyisobutyrate dehydrogenase/glyoxylate/succinic semialdehyde reductase